MTHTADHLAQTAASLVQREGGLIPFIRHYGFGGVAYAIILQMIAGVQNAGLILLGPVRALGRGLILLVDVTLGGVADVFGAGTATTVRSFVSGTASLLGPFAQPASVGIGMLTFAVFIYGINRLSISPLSFLQSLRN